MEIKADPGNVLMSDVLKGNVADIDPDQLDELQGRYVLAVIDRTAQGQRVPITGIMLSVLFDLKPEIEVKVELNEALDLIEAKDQVINLIDLHHGERIVPLKGPFKVAAARIQEVDPKVQMCVLHLQLERVKLHT